MSLEQWIFPFASEEIEALRSWIDYAHQTMSEAGLDILPFAICTTICYDKFHLKIISLKIKEKYKMICS